MSPTHKILFGDIQKMETYLHTVNADILCSLVTSITDYSRLEPLLYSIPERADTTRNCVRNILINSEPEIYKFIPQNVFLYPNLERIDLLLEIKTSDLPFYGLHPSLRKMRISLIERGFVGDALLAFVRNFRSGEYVYEGKRIHNNRSFENAFIAVYIRQNYGKPAPLILSGVHMMQVGCFGESSKEKLQDAVERIFEASGARELWSTGYVLPKLNFYRFHDLDDYSGSYVANSIAAAYNHLISDEAKLRTRRYQLHFIGKLVKTYYLTFLWNLGSKILEHFPKNRWDEVRIPILAGGGNRFRLDTSEWRDRISRLIEILPEMTEYEFVVTQLEDVYNLPPMTKVEKIYSLPGKTIAEEIPQYPVYADAEELLRAYITSQ